MRANFRHYDPKSATSELSCHATASHCRTSLKCQIFFPIPKFFDCDGFPRVYAEKTASAQMSDLFFPISEIF